MRRRLVGAARCAGIPVRYYLLANAGKDGRRNYGVLVESGSDRALIPSVAASRRRVRVLLTLMMQGRVTPATARDVVEDWLLA